MIETKNISKWYNGFQVLTDCTTNVKKSEVMVVCGPSGFGKSTLIRTVNVPEPLQKGEIFTDDASVGTKGANLSELRSRVSMVFRNSELSPYLSIAENLTTTQQRVLGRSREEAMAKSLEYLDRVSLRVHAAKYPGQLSGGQQQRVAIARTLSMGPICMLFDKPASVLDPGMVNEILNVIVELAKEDMTMVCVTREMGFVCKIVNRVIFMDQGHIVRDREKEEFFGNINTHSDHIKQFLSKILSH